MERERHTHTHRGLKGRQTDRQRGRGGETETQRERQRAGGITVPSPLANTMHQLAPTTAVDSCGTYAAGEEGGVEVREGGEVTACEVCVCV